MHAHRTAVKFSHPWVIYRKRRQIVPLLEIVIVLIVVGVILWLINTYIPMAAPIKSLLNAVVVIALVVWILKAFGLWHYLTNLRVGH
jgi:hypothetical protein